ncbi:MULTISPECIES: hypothetical protein [Providencia]|uniref:Uncharacterized protein n=1 Tax=Providencia alcalifaciens 205/92 TaxID=1256988 RepID=A0AAV3M955_9GAMM|nr:MULTISPECIES: hypothetical protein [Providencia]EUD12552.1 hypothetical protein HMPREF1563_2556 [Providencia alcalifaciens 205/92]WGZ55105.1 hypothetical protein PO864_03755 [Providencia alcalifaciens]
MQQIMRVLRKLYKYENSQYDGERAVSIYSVDCLSDKERNVLEDFQWQANTIEEFADHQDMVNKLHSLKQVSVLTRQRCLDAFVAGVGGSYLRGRSVLGAYHKLNALPDHVYVEKPQYACCWICSGYNKRIYINDSYFQYCLYYGNSYTGNPSYAYLNLRHLMKIEAIKPTDDDKKVFNQLLDFLRNAPEDETPGKFEKRLSQAKIVKGDKYTLRGILHSLALIGVIPNTFISLSLDSWHDFGDITGAENQLNNTKGRSDMEMPWAGWKGSLKIDEEKAVHYFGDYLTKG